MNRVKVKKGSILITALVVISLCTSLALFIHEKSTGSYGAVADLQDEYQGAIYAMTAVAAIESVFSYDDAKSDGREDLWNSIPPIPVDKGFLTVHIAPLNARFPVNALSQDNETLRERYETGFEKLMTLLEFENADFRDLEDWLGTGNVSSERFDENNTPYSTKGAALNTLAELAYIPAFENNYKELSKYLSIGESGYKININLAPEEVILAVLPELEPYISDILSAREEEDFKDVSDIYEIMGSSAQEEYNAILPYFDVKSSMFYVKIELNVGEDNKYYHILFRRSGKSAKPVKYIEGGNIEYY